VESILSTTSGNHSVEKSFSRRRGFRKALKRAEAKKHLAQESIDENGGGPHATPVDDYI
jgi:hypothetical protein